MCQSVIQIGETLHSFLAESHAWFERDALSVAKFETSGVQQWGLASLDLAREHSHAILQHLNPCSARKYGTAAALQRPLLASVLRGYLFSFCPVDNKEADTFRDARNKYSSMKLIERISVVQPQVGAYLNAVFPNIENALHRYTHGDVHQLSRRLAPGSGVVQPRIDEADVISLLALTSRLTIFAMMGMLDHAGDISGLKSLATRLEELDRIVKIAGDILTPDIPDNRD